VIVAASDRIIGGWLTDEAPTITGGYGGWDTVQRPKKASLTVWEGRDPFQLTIPLLLSRAGQPVSSDIHDIAVLSSGTSKGRPPLVQVFGTIMLPVHAGDDWVIQDVSWGESIWRQTDAVIIRQHVTLTLLEFVDDQLLPASTLASRRDGRAIIRHYRVKKGDTLRSIAARQLGDPRRWSDIAVLNGLRSSGKLKPNTLLKLP
jgi:hypothetical protein